ncbi:MAG: hypothetical protein Fur0022_07570 [Anaerolineales bacterium]
MEKQDLSISMGKAGLYSLILSLPIAFLQGWAFAARWGWEAFRVGFDALYGNLFQFLAIFIVGVVVHEVIHGLAWAYFGKKPLSAIKFGFQWATFTPYAHCKEPMEVNAYRIGALMPGLVLGFLPALIGIATGWGAWLAFSLIFTTAAGGDFLILWLLRGVQAGKQVEDHPSQAGCYVLE